MIPITMIKKHPRRGDLAFRAAALASVVDDGDGDAVVNITGLPF